MSEENEHANQQVPRVSEEEETLHDSLDEKVPKKKVVGGVGLGNIFDGGTISLRKSDDIVVKPEESHPAPFSVENMPETGEKVVIDAVHSNGSKEKASTGGSTSDQSRDRALVLFSYKAEHEDELDLIEGEEVFVLQRDIEDPGWYRGEAHGKVGVFPDNFVRLIPAQKPKKPPPPSREALARSTYISSGSPPPVESPMSQSTDNVSASSDTITADNVSRPPPLPPKDIGPKPGKLGIGVIPNIGQLRNMLKSSGQSPENGPTGRSMFYIAAPSAEGDPTLLIVPEQGATVTTVLFHPTKGRARPVRKHQERRRAVKFDESMGSVPASNVDVHSPFIQNNNENARDPLSVPASFQVPPLVPQHVRTPIPTNPNSAKVLHNDNKPQLSASVTNQPVWEKRVSPDSAASLEQRYQDVESDSTSAMTKSLPAPLSGSSFKRQPPVVPPAATVKKPPPVVPKKSTNLQSQQRSSMELTSSTSAPEPAPSPKPSPLIAEKSKTETVVKPVVATEKPPSPPLTNNEALPSNNNQIAAVNARCDRLDKLVQDLRRDLTSAQNDVRRLTAELDEEKKARLAAQVDLERLRKTITNSNAQTGPAVPTYPPPQPPGRPPPPNDPLLQSTKI